MTDTTERLRTSLADRYRIERELGQGGMATVYLATDLRHQRPVAIKVVRSEISASMGSERFLREIRLAARLNHPNILALYDSGDAEGELYYVMPVAEGESLRDRLTREKSLPVGDAVRLASEVAGALDYAHRREVVHRDIKPENILLHEGHALITDFGIGKALSTAATGATLTQLGLVVGTPAYMSPEQAGGEPNLDGRSDLYSLGCVLYEMLAGEPPFTGSTVQAVIAKRFKETPPDPTASQPSIPRAVADITRKLMAMEPSQRFGKGAEVVEALARSLTPSTGTAAYHRSTESASSRLPWVAVLPFQSRDPGLSDFAEGLVDDIITGLSRFPHLQVVARQAAASGARYLIEGNLRKSGSTVRLTAQLVDAGTGTHLWAESFDRDLTGTGIFALQDELTDRIVATVADPFGILVRVMAKPLLDRPVEDLTVDELCIRLYAHNQVVSPQEHARLRTAFEAALEQEPNHAEGWAALSGLYASEKMHLLNPLPHSLERALAAAQRAVQINAASQPALESLAEVQYYMGDVAAFRQSAERVLALNPRNSSAGAVMAMLTAFGGDWERGFELVNRMMALNPLHAGWFYFVPFHYHYRRGEYEKAYEAVKRMNMPEMVWGYRCAASVCVELGRWEEARAAVLELRRRFPGIEELVNIGAGQENWVHDDELMERQTRAWRRAVAAAESPGDHVPQSRARPTTDVTASRLPWIAVLPFATRDTELVDLAEGISEEVITGLSKFPMLQVVSWQSSRRTAGGDLREAGTTLGARYLVEGSIRKSGRQVRVNAQLVDVETGASLWAESYDRNLDRQSLFELQDDLTDRIVVTVADPFGVLVRAMAVSLKERPASELTASELVIRMWAYSYQVGPEEHAILRDAFERLLQREPDHAEAWSCLADLYWEEQLHGMNMLPEPLERARRAAQRAVECNPATQFGWAEVALVQYFSGDVAASRQTAERTIALNPRNGGTCAILAMALAFGGQWDRGLEVIRRLMDLNPHHAGWYHFIPFHWHFRKGEYEQALATAKRVNMPQLPWNYTVLAMAAAELGRWDEVRRALDELRQRFPHVLEMLHSVPGAGWFMDQDYLAQQSASWRKMLAGPAEETNPTQSIAVLPFTNMSPDADDSYFADGITEEIINALAQVPGLNVAARTSCFAFKDKSEDLRVVGEKLGVQHILEGSVRKAGSRVRITAQLIKAGDGYHLWSERYDRELVDIFALQDEIAQAIAGKLSLALGHGPAGEPEKVRNVEAYELMLKGRALLWLRGRAILDALPVLTRATELDPELVDAHALLGDALRLKWLYGMAPAGETIPAARAAIERALHLEPDNPQALSALANIIAVHDLDKTRAVDASNRALAREPRFVQALCEKAIWLALRTDTSPRLFEESLEAVHRARGIDPLSSWVAALEAFVLLSGQRDREAVEASRRAVALEPGAFTGRWALVWSLSAVGADEEALALARETLPMSGRNPRILTEMAAIHARRGETGAVAEILAELRQRAEAGYIELCVLGCVTAAAGNLAEARTLVARGIAEHEPYFQFAKSPAWAAFRADPEGHAMLVRVGF